MNSQDRFLLLLNKYTTDNLDIIEHDELFAMIASGEYDDIFNAHFLSKQVKDNLPGADMSPDRAQEMLLNILVSEEQTAHIIPSVINRNRRMIWACSAAAIVLAFIAGFWWIQNNKRDDKVAYARHFASNMIEKINEADHPLRIQLEDSSFLTLQPGARINYPVHFTGNKREVFMDGEVFFEIKKQHGMPFFVYNDNIITQVLGTKFTVKMDKEKKQVEVAVVCGKVQVSENKRSLDPGDNKKGKAVILLPNQRVIYKENEQQFNATLVSNPVPVLQETARVAAPAVHVFVFDDSPLSGVIAKLEKIYGIEIITQNDGLNNCLFTGDVDKYDLYTKLDIICQSVKATYEINGTKILIKGQGCY